MPTSPIMESQTNLLVTMPPHLFLVQFQRFTTSGLDIKNLKTSPCNSKANEKTELVVIELSAKQLLRKLRKTNVGEGLFQCTAITTEHARYSTVLTAPWHTP